MVNADSGDHPVQETNDFFQSVLDSLSQGVCVFDADGCVSQFNPSLPDLLDVPPEFLASGPTLREMYDFQTRRGDFAGETPPQDAEASPDAEPGGVTEHYLRLKHLGRTLQVKTRRLAGARLVQTVADVSDYVLAEAGRKRANQMLFATQALAELGGWELDLQHNQVTWTDGVYRIFETTPQAFAPSPATVRPLFTDESLAIDKASYQPSGEPTSTHEYEIEMLTLKGRRIWLYSRGTTLWEQGQPVKRTTIVQDITRRKQTEMALRDSEARWKLALESVGDGVWDLQVQSGEQYLSPNLLRIYGYADGELKAGLAELDALVHPDDLARVQHDRQAHLQGNTLTYNNEHRVQCKDGSWKWVHSRGMVISRDAQGQALRMLGTHTDITERKTADELVWQQAHFDALTGLPNRRLLRERLVQEMKKCRRNHYKLGLLFIDLDHFKEINDTLGHDRGDELLVEAARRIQHCLREVDTVARMGGDEFTVIVTALADEANLQSILPKLLDALSEPFQLGLDQVFVSASMGVTVYPNDTEDVEDLLKNADQALYVAKAAGRNRFSFFTASLQEAAMQRAQLTHDLRAALPARQFFMVYQPIVNLANGRIQKAEALIRWLHPTRGLISPVDFIPIAESSGLIVEMGEWVFHQAAAQVNAWRTHLHPQFQISVNKSPLQFEKPNPIHLPWIDQLRALGLPGESIVVEITEGLLLSSSTGVVEQLLRLRDEGINVSLDDFGTGYSSLSYLQKFDIDFIKIDQSFVRHLKVGTTDLALCQAIIAMAHALGMKVIAEGVETAEQRDLLRAAGCDYAQGYFYSRPLSPVEFEAMVQRSEHALDLAQA
jgi:diguanylate cyclase (GGDEF)-like protein/PAS domain S-box-containing protein